MSNVTALPALSPLPPDLPDRLRELAEDVESGRITAMVIAYVDEGNYRFMWPSSLIESITLTTLAHATAVDRFRVQQ